MDAISDSGNNEQRKARVNGIGLWAAALVTILTLLAFGIAIAAPPRSGPLCEMASCVTYPYTDVAAFFPRDYLWMFPGILIAPVFVILVACIHCYAPEDKKVFSLIALSFASMATTVITTDYFIQLSVIQPSLLRGETDGLSLFSQYNPHGVFIALESLGYLMMSVAFLFLAPVFAGGERVERGLPWLFTASFGLSILSLVTLSLIYGYDIEYRFEVVVISIDWIALIIAGILLSILFRRASQYAHSV